MIDTVLRGFGILWCLASLALVWLVIDSITYERAYKRGYADAAELVNSLEGIDSL